MIRLMPLSQAPHSACPSAWHAGQSLHHSYFWVIWFYLHLNQRFISPVSYCPLTHAYAINQSQTSWLFNKVDAITYSADSCANETYGGAFLQNVVCHGLSSNNVCTLSTAPASQPNLTMWVSGRTCFLLLKMYFFCFWKMIRFNSIILSINQSSNQSSNLKIK